MKCIQDHGPHVMDGRIIVDVYSQYTCYDTKSRVNRGGLYWVHEYNIRRYKDHK